MHELQKTNDGGLTWVSVKSLVWEGGILNFVSEQVGDALAYNQGVVVVVRTGDGGKPGK